MIISTKVLSYIEFFLNKIDREWEGSDIKIKYKLFQLICHTYLKLTYHNIEFSNIFYMPIDQLEEH